MMQFDVRDDGTISINPATLAIAEFRAIYERDTTDTRRRAWLELSAIFFMTSMSSGNPYKGYPKEDRISEINMEIFQGEAPFDLQDPEIEKALLKALELDKLSIARDALRTAINGTHKLKMYLDSLKLDERDNQNKPVHNMKQYQETLTRMAGVSKALTELEKDILQEEEEMLDKVRGGADDEFNV